MVTTSEPRIGLSEKSHPWLESHLAKDICEKGSLMTILLEHLLLPELVAFNTREPVGSKGGGHFWEFVKAIVSVCK